MTETADSTEAAALATSVMLMNLMGRLIAKGVIDRSELRAILQNSIADLAAQRTIISARQAIEFMERLLAKFPE